MLDIKLTPVHNGEHRDPGDLLGSLWIALSDTPTACPLLACTWELGRFVAWWLAHRGALREAPAFTVAPGESLAAAVRRIEQELPEPGPDALDEQLYAFRIAHSLRFALPGADIPEIFLGCNHGRGELSRVDAVEAWRINFDFDAFSTAMDLETDAFLRAWRGDTRDPLAQRGAAQLLGMLSVARGSKRID